MEDLNVVGGLQNAEMWLAKNHELLIQYAVNLVAAIFILVFGLLAAKLISGMVSRVMHLRHIDLTVSDFLSTLVRYAVIAFTIIAVLGRIGVQTTSVIAVIGAAGLAVGLALQGSLSNFAAGVLLVMFRQFRVGESVDLGGVAGTVTHVQIFSTTLLTGDNKVIIVPNGKVIAGNIINTSREPNSRTDLIISVSYDAEIAKVKQVLGDIATADTRIMQEKGVVIRLNEMGASTLDFVVRYWTTNGDSQNVKWDLFEQFKEALDANGIGIPYPQMDVHLFRSAEAVVAEAKAKQSVQPKAEPAQAE